MLQDETARQANAEAMAAQALVQGLLMVLVHRGVLDKTALSQVYGFAEDTATAAAYHPKPEARKLGTEVLRIIGKLRADDNA